MSILNIPEIEIRPGHKTIIDDTTYELTNITNNGSITIDIKIKSAKVNDTDKNNVTSTYIQNNQYEPISTTDKTNAKYYFDTPDLVVFTNPNITDDNNNIKLLELQDYKQGIKFKIPINYLDSTKLFLDKDVGSLKNLMKGFPEDNIYKFNDILRKSIIVKKYYIKKKTINAQEYYIFDGSNAAEYILSFPFLLYIYLKRPYNHPSSGQGINTTGININDSILKTKNNLIFFNIEDFINLYSNIEELIKTYPNFSFQNMKEKLLSLYRNKQYVLTGIVEGGGTHGGHYISHVYNENVDKWFTCDDSNIGKPMNIEEIKKKISRNDNNKINSFTFYLRDIQ